MAGSDLLPWEHATSGLCLKHARDWLVANGRVVSDVYAVEWWAVFYVSPEDEARHQEWKLDKSSKLIPNGQPKLGWPPVAVDA